MKNLKSILKKTALALVFATSLGLSKQVDEEHFDRVEFCDERGKGPGSCNYWGVSTSVSARAFINENVQANLVYRDEDNDGKFDEISFWIKKNDFILLKEIILFDNKKGKNYIKEYVSGRSYLKDDGEDSWWFYEPDNAIKEIRNIPLEEITLKKRERISEIINLKKDKESLTNFLEKEYEEKNDALNPDSPNTTYNQIERISKLEKGLDRIKKDNFKEDYREYDGLVSILGNNYFRMEDYKPKDIFPMKTRITGSKKGVDYVYFGTDWNCLCYLYKILNEEIKGSYYLLNVVNFTNNHEVIIETIRKNENFESSFMASHEKDLRYVRKIYKMDKKGHAERMKYDPRELNAYSKGAKPSDFSPKDRERIKEIMNCYKTESLLKDFIQKEYERNNP